MADKIENQDLENQNNQNGDHTNTSPDEWGVDNGGIGEGSINEDQKSISRKKRGAFASIVNRFKIPLYMEVNKYLRFTTMNNWESALCFANPKYLFTCNQAS